MVGVAFESFSNHITVEFTFEIFKNIFTAQK